jgi:2-succinyl-6-hydroxy-2,4-cyclohexadiene-1-carboxylate synthase
MGTLNIKWHCHEAGDPSGIPILFLHGFMAHGRIWLSTMNQLPNGMYSVALDLPGHGKTLANLEALDFDSLSEAVAAFIQNHFGRPVVLAGYSMGGRIALYTALSYPQSISALILESATAGIDGDAERNERVRQDQERAEGIRGRGLQAYLTDWYEQPLFASLKRRPGLIESIIQKKLDNNPEKLAEVVVRLSPGYQKSLWNVLNQWDKPALIVCGELDDKYCEIGRRMGSLLRKSELRIISDAGHIVHLENNKDFVAALNFFLTTYIL